MNTKRTIDQLISDLKNVNQQTSDLNTFADMKTTVSERKSILLEWAKISQQRESIINERYGRSK